MTPHDRKTAGFTLIELLVAVAILSIGAVAAFRSYNAAQRSIGGQWPRVVASEVAMNRAAELRLSGMLAGRSLPQEVQMGGFEWSVSVTERAAAGGLVAAQITVRASDQPGAQLEVYVPREAQP